MSQSTGSLRHRTLRSLFWQLLGVGGQRVVQLASPIVLWRLLEQHDLGLFAILLSAIGVLESLTTFSGDQTAIWSERGGERRYLDTLFTVRVLRSLVISTCLGGLAWPFAWFFGTEETDARYWLPGLFLALAGNGLLDALQSPARAAQMKGLDFRRIALGDFVASLLGLCVRIGFALWRPDVWALIAGHLAGTALTSAISYAVAPHRPRFRLDRGTLRELFHYHKGAAGTPFLLLMVFTAPPFVLGKAIGGGAVAVFDGAARLAKLPEDIFLRVLGPVAIPAYAQLQHDRPRLARAWSRAVHAFLLVGTPLTIGLGWCGDALPTIVFGAKYVAVPGLLALLALHGGLAGLTSVVGPLFWAIGQPHFDRRAQFCRCLVLYGLGIPATILFGVLGFALAMCLAIAMTLAMSLWFALRYFELRAAALVHMARDGFLAGLALASVLLGIDAVLAPTGLVRLGLAAVFTGPLLGYSCLRLLRHRTEPALPTPPPGLGDLG